MAIITDISPQKKDQKRFNIFIDGAFAFGISADLRFEKKLKTGQTISEKDVKSLIVADQTERLLNKALKFLSFRPRSEQEVRVYLLRRGKLKDIEKSESEKKEYEKSIDEVILKLRGFSYLDDKEFASWWLDQRTKYKLSGGYLIKSELIQKGVDKEIIKEILDGLDEEKMALEVAKKKTISYKRLNKEELRIKLGQFLARRGFNWSTIKKVVDTLLKNQ